MHPSLRKRTCLNALWCAASVVAVSLCASCSTKHNTALSRGYQRLTSRYNVYYNGREAFEQGIERIRTNSKNDYSHVLPVYEFSNERTARSAQADMETALKKAHKLIQLHSITVKPEYSGSLTEEQKRFRSKNEFNPFVAEAYLLIGKANVVMHSEQEALEQFDYISRMHEGERAAYEARIWKAIAYSQIGQYNNAVAALKSYDMDGVAPANLYPEYQAAYADVFISQGRYAEAIPYMERAEAEVKNSHNRNRYGYILAQLYRATGQRDKAAPIFLRLSRLMGDYDMAFAAKLDLPTVASTPQELAKARKALAKMAKDPKNKDQLDQVYYAIGHLQLGMGDQVSAISAFNSSVAASVSNDNQKGLSFLSLADIYQAEPMYIEASTSLDSAAFFLDDANERKHEAAQRAALLAPLAAELRTIRDNDSLLMIANMTESQRNDLIDAMVKEHNDRLDQMNEQREADAQNAMSPMDFYQIQQGAASGSSWYFYNTQIVTAGKATFRSKWGNRKNEDDWRRSNKSLALNGLDAQDDDAAEREALEQAQEEMAKRGQDERWTREMLLDNVPLTPGAKAKNQQATADAMLKGASILYDDVKDYVRCAELLEEYWRRFPTSQNLYDALSLLHFAQSRCGDAPGQAKTDAQILRQFPNSLMAKNISDPSFASQLAQSHQAAEDAYEQAYNAYLAGDFTVAIAKSSDALADGRTEVALRPNYLLVRALSHAKSGETEPFRADLASIRADHAGTPQDSMAAKLLALLDEGRMPVRHEAYESPLAGRTANADSSVVEKVSYAYAPDSAHVVVCFVDDGMLKEAQFAVSDYNFSNFLIQDYDVAMRPMPLSSQAIIIGRFANRKEAEVYFYAVREQTFWKHLTSQPIPRIYMMSVQNAQLLQLSGPDEAFEAFMKEYYGI